MADLSITAANVVCGEGAKTKKGTAGVGLAAGQLIFKDSADSKMKLSDSDGAVDLRTVAGIALHTSVNNQPILYQDEGEIVIGATLVPGSVYVASDTAGGIMPHGDLETGDYLTIVGYAKSDTILVLTLLNTGVVRT